MWAEKEGALGRKESDTSHFTALLIVFPTGDTPVIALTARSQQESFGVRCITPQMDSAMLFASASTLSQARLWSRCFLSNAFYVPHRWNQAQSSGWGLKCISDISGWNTPSLIRFRNELLAFIRCWYVRIFGKSAICQEQGCLPCLPLRCEKARVNSAPVTPL